MFKPILSKGFTLIELVMVMVIVGVLGAVAAPRFFGTNVFQSRGFADQLKATISYAQKAAIAQNHFVCVTFTSNCVELTIGATSACDTELKRIFDVATSFDGIKPPPSCITNSSIVYFIKVPSGVTFTTTPTSFYFDTLGRPSFMTAQSIAVSGYATPVIVEAETGYVH
ncbi:MAG: type II secretion system protein [Nitrosomonadales bacterium]